MPISCPCCKASNEAGPTCRRCKADLLLLFTLEARRAALIGEARRLAAECRFPESAAILAEAAQLRQGADVQQLRAVVSLLARDFPAALKAHQSATEQAKP